MRLIASRYLNDGKPGNDGRAVELIRIDEPADYDRLLDNILASGFYDSGYFDRHIGYRPTAKRGALICALAAQALEAGPVLELGCGRGDFLLAAQALTQAEVCGLELSRDIIDQAWPQVKSTIIPGDLVVELDRLGQAGRRFDFLAGFDVWEHLHPTALDQALDRARAVLAEDGLALAILPAFGEDQVFGEIFPLELEENRAAFDGREPFPYLIRADFETPVPASGHLVWAHTDWWTDRFASHGFFRAYELERRLHDCFDDFLEKPEQAFYLLGGDSAPARARIDRLLDSRWTPYRNWRRLIDWSRTMDRLAEEAGRPAAPEDFQEPSVHHAQMKMVEAWSRRATGWLGGSEAVYKLIERCIGGAVRRAGKRGWV